MKTESKHYGIVDGITECEPGSIAGNLSVSSALAGSVHSVASAVVVGSTTSSPINLAQLVLTAEQAIELGTLLSQAGADALAADRAVENLRRHGPAAARLCLALAEASDHDVLVDQSKIRLGYSREAQDLASRAYHSAAESAAKDAYHRGDWRRIWREAGERLSKEVSGG